MQSTLGVEGSDLLEGPCFDIFLILLRFDLSKQSGCHVTAGDIAEQRENFVTQAVASGDGLGVRSILAPIFAVFPQPVMEFLAAGGE